MNISMNMSMQPTATRTHTLRSSALRAACRLIGGDTVLTERYHEAPLKIAKTFRDETSGALSLILMDVSPGLMDGDSYAMNILLQERTHLILTNQSYTKVHPAPHHGARTDYRFTLERGAILEYFPEPTIPYAGSRLEAATAFQLAEGAALLYAEITTPGRTHRGEQFQFDSFSSRTVVRREGRMVAWDHFLLEPAIHNYSGPGAMENYTHSGVFWIFADRAGEELLHRIRALLPPPSPENDILAGASLSAHQGIVIRMLGHRVWQLEQLRDSIWAEARSWLWHYPPCRLRK